MTKEFYYADGEPIGEFNSLEEVIDYIKKRLPVLREKHSKEWSPITEVHIAREVLVLKV